MLTLLCVTKAEPHALMFLNAMIELSYYIDARVVFAADGDYAEATLSDICWARRYVSRVDSQGYLESALDAAVSYCDAGYILRLDDDETVSPAMADWLSTREFQKAPNWKFPRAHLWYPSWYIVTPHLFPDHQTRLSIKELSGNRRQIHAGNPDGGGEAAPVLLCHHKFICRTRSERRAIVDRYDSIVYGAGTNFLPFQIPEEFYAELPLAKLGEGWYKTNPDITKVVSPLG